MSVQRESLDAQASIHLRVPRGAAGEIAGGAREVLENVHVVASADVASVDAVRPSRADLHVDVTARLELAVADEDPDAVRAALLDGFGVERADTLVLNYGE